MIFNMFGVVVLVKYLSLSLTHSNLVGKYFIEAQTHTQKKTVNVHIIGDPMVEFVHRSPEPT